MGSEKRKHGNRFFRMCELLRYFLFNVLLPTIDIATDFFTFLTLLPDHPHWASVILTWMFTSFLVNATMFIIKKAKGTGTHYSSFGDLALDFYKEAGIHLPFVVTFHNLWRMKILHDLKYGARDFKMKDHEKVEKILKEAGMCSHAESMYEAGPQTVTQVRRYSNYS